MVCEWCISSLGGEQINKEVRVIPCLSQGAQSVIDDR